MKIGSRVRIKEMQDYSYDPELPSLAPGSEGRIVDEFQHPFRASDFAWIVRLADGDFPFYPEEIERIS